MTRALVFFPHNLFPPRSGAHQRCLQILQALALLDVDVTLASSAHTSDTTWDNVNEQDWRAAGVTKLAIHTPNKWDPRAIHYELQLYAKLRRQAPLNSFNYAPPSLIRWFGKLAAEDKPDLILNNYVFWGRLISSKMHRTTTTVIDTHDLISLYRPRFLLMEQYLTAPPISTAQVDPRFLQEDFFDAYNFQVSEQEYKILGQYGYTLAITSADAGLMAQHTRHTQVVTLPMTQPLTLLNNQFDGAAIYTSSDNPFNVQGYLYFVCRVLPRVLEQEPTFCLHVTGSICSAVLPAEGVELRGFVPDLNSEYAHAPFLICPILGKTGQQVKIVEAMAHGVPVIATRAAADGSPIVNEVNGLIARDTDEFAAHVVRLWRDRETCRRMGNAARETIAKEYSQQRTLDTLKMILGQTH